MLNEELLYLLTFTTTSTVVVVVVVVVVVFFSLKPKNLIFIFFFNSLEKNFQGHFFNVHSLIQTSFALNPACQVIFLQSSI